MGTRRAGGTERFEMPLEPESIARLRVVIARLSRGLRPTAAAAGSLTSSEVEVLSAVGRRGPLRLSDLASLAGFNPTMLSRIVAHLEDLKLLRRLGDESDRRVSLVELTSAGRSLHDRVRSERTGVLARELADMCPAQRDAIVASLPALEELAERLLERGAGEATRADRRVAR